MGKRLRGRRLKKERGKERRMVARITSTQLVTRPVKRWQCGSSAETTGTIGTVLEPLPAHHLSARVRCVKVPTKATDVPDYTNNDEDARSAFHRFSAFVDDESQQSDDDGWYEASTLASRPVISPSDGKLDDQQRQQSSIDADANYSVLGTDDTTSPRRLSTSWSANVGVKRTLLDQGSENVFEAIDEITKDVFDSTRPLPPSKPDHTPGSQKSQLTSNDCSHHNLRPSVQRKSSEHWISPPGVFRRRSPEVVIYRSRDAPESQHNSKVSAMEEERPLGQITPESDELHVPDKAHDRNVKSASPKSDPSSSLTILTRTSYPTSPLAIASPQSRKSTRSKVHIEDAKDKTEHDVRAVRGKRKLTGLTSKHFRSEKQTRRIKSVSKTIENADLAPVPRTVVKDVPQDQNVYDTGVDLKPAKKRPGPAKDGLKKLKRKSTRSKSEYFLPLELLDRVDLPETHLKRVAGVSSKTAPSIKCERFGIIQEKLWQEPFWLIIAVTFLNKTTGSAATPTFWALKNRWPTPEALAEANETELEDMIHHLGLQSQRTKRVIRISRSWLSDPPVAGKRYRTLHYPVKGDGKTYKKLDAIEEDAADCGGALEIGHIPGCGPYAWDSWRIFCRDTLRGVAEDFNGKGAKDVNFEPEWRRVLPLDKELRAALRWMWLREGWIWNHETGEKRRATPIEVERAVQGEMDLPDAQEQKFAAHAANAQLQNNSLPQVTGVEATSDSDKPLETPRKELSRTGTRATCCCC